MHLHRAEYLAHTIGPLYHIAPLGVGCDGFYKSQALVNRGVALDRWGRCGGGVEHGISWGRAPPLGPRCVGTRGRQLYTPPCAAQ